MFHITKISLNKLCCVINDDTHQKQVFCKFYLTVPKAFMESQFKFQDQMYDLCLSVNSSDFETPHIYAIQ